MTALDIVLNNYKGTNIESETIKGIKNFYYSNDLDCNCVDCDDSSDCSTPW